MNFKTPIAQSGVDVRVSSLRLPRSLVPQHHGTAAVLPRGNDALEASVLDRMIFDLHGQALVAGDVARPLRDCPALQDAIPAQPKVVVQMRGRMLLNAEGKSLRSCFWRKLRLSAQPLSGSRASTGSAPTACLSRWPLFRQLFDAAAAFFGVDAFDAALV